MTENMIDALYKDCIVHEQMPVEYQEGMEIFLRRLKQSLSAHPSIPQGQTVYVPTPVSEKPDKSGWYLIQAPNNMPVAVGRSFFNGEKWNWSDTPGRYFNDGCKLEWLKPLPVAAIPQGQEEAELPFEKFLDGEVTLGISDKKTIERIRWYWQTFREGQEDRMREAVAFADWAEVKGYHKDTLPFDANSWWYDAAGEGVAKDTAELYERFKAEPK